MDTITGQMWPSRNIKLPSSVITIHFKKHQMLILQPVPNSPSSKEFSVNAKLN